MEFRQAVRKCMIEKYHPLIEGRAARSEFWWFFLFNILVSVGIALVMGMLIAAVVVPLTLSDADAATGMLASFVPLMLIMIMMPLMYYMMPPAVAVTIRRLHDRNMSGWWYLWFTIATIIPGINILAALAMLVLMLLPGTKGPNRFGADPLAPQTSIFA